MEQQELADRIAAISQLSGVYMRLIEDDGRMAMGVGTPCTACTYFQQHFDSPEVCMRLEKLAAVRAGDIGETYVFSCPLGLCSAVRTLSGAQRTGAVLAGPFLLEEPDTLIIRELAHSYNKPLVELLDLYELIRAVPTLTPAAATALSRLMNYLFDDGNEQQLRQHRLFTQQQQIGESLQAYKSFTGGLPAYPYEKEQELIGYIQAGSVHEANRILNDLLGYALFSTGSDLDTIKSWASALCTLLSRAARHHDGNSSFETDPRFMRSLWATDSPEKLALLLQELVERFCQSVFPDIEKGENNAVLRAIRYIELHFAEPITLTSTACNVFLSPSYLSTVFKKELGITFNAFLNTTRINEAKHLMTQGQDNITQIAFAVGYESQSYFSKVFHRLTGISPSEYLKTLSDR